MGDSFAFQKIQKQITAYIRDPEHISAPKNSNIERLDVYKTLLFNNIKETINNAFPVCSQVLSNEQLETLTRDFFKNYQSDSPYFHDIPKLFVEYLSESSDLGVKYPIFLAELAHYEWVELALDLAIEPEGSIPADLDPDGDLLEAAPVLSPFAWLLQYQFPVQTIGADYQPKEVPAEPTFLIIVRNQQNEINFIKISLLTAHLINIILQNSALTGKAALVELATAAQAKDVDAFVAEGTKDLYKLKQNAIIIGTRGHQ